MSAGKDAKPIGLNGWLIKGRDISADEVKSSLPGVSCDCGWNGGLWELLEEDGSETIWCPQCRTSGWEYE